MHVHKHKERNLIVNGKGSIYTYIHAWEMHLKILKVIENLKRQKKVWVSMYREKL